MATVEVRLLGRPEVRVDGLGAAPPRGAKSWAVLAYVAVTGRPVARSELAELLFSGAVDPLGALRWSLAAIRRAVGRPDVLKGDPIALDPSELAVDVVELGAGNVEAALGGGELLAGISLPDSPLFELWLASERQRLKRHALSLLRDTSVEAFARGDHELAVRSARQLVVADPFDEGHHALLIRTLALIGEPDAAERHFESCAELLESELRAQPGPAILAAVHLARQRGVVPHPERDEVGARIDVAWQSFLGGALDHGIDRGRSGVELADAHGDPVLRIAGRLVLAGMLGMAVRGWDEVATATSEAAHLAGECGLTELAARARAVRAGNELMRGDYQAACGHASAGAALCDEPGTLALNLSFLAAAEIDTGRAELAAAHVARAVGQAERSGDPISLAYAHAYTGHVELLLGAPEAARPAVERAIEACASVLVLKPWPMAMQAEVEVGAGRLAEAARTAELADGLAAATGVAYQRALAQRALALVAAAQGDGAAAVEHLLAALALARRTSQEGYAFHWPVAWVLETLATVSAGLDESEGRRWADALHAHASALGMTTFVERADRLAGQLA